MGASARKSVLAGYAKSWVANFEHAASAALQRYKNNALIDVSSWIDCTARASSGATDSDLIFPQACASAERGIEFETTTSLILDSMIRFTAGPKAPHA